MRNIVADSSGRCVKSAGWVLEQSYPQPVGIANKRAKTGLPKAWPFRPVSGKSRVIG